MDDGVTLQGRDFVIGPSSPGCHHVCARPRTAATRPARRAVHARACICTARSIPRVLLPRSTALCACSICAVFLARLSVLAVACDMLRFLHLPPHCCTWACAIDQSVAAASLALLACMRMPSSPPPAHAHQQRQRAHRRTHIVIPPPSPGLSAPRSTWYPLQLLSRVPGLLAATWLLHVLFWMPLLFWT